MVKMRIVLWKMYAFGKIVRVRTTRLYNIGEIMQAEFCLQLNVKYGVEYKIQEA
jgi:hypothetical protein